MEVLKSNMMSAGLDDESHANPVGIYGSNGFFFQQRRGHINLRSLNKLDLDRLVREVDIDLLQLHIENLTFSSLREEDLRYMTDPQVIKLFKISQLTIEYLLYSQDQLVTSLNNLSSKYSAKKKSLTKKRRELAELSESTKHLRNQIKAKKQNIATLEDLLKETNRTRERDYHRMKRNLLSTSGKENKLPASNVLRFYIAGPEGICVEFNEAFDTRVATLLADVRKAFVSKRDVDKGEIVTIKLIYQGKLLQENLSLEACEIHQGDTVVAVVEREKARPATPPREVPRENELGNVLEFLSKQQDSMKDFARDIKDGWEKALVTMVHARPEEKATHESELLDKLNEKLGNFEYGIRDQLDRKLQQYESLVAQKAQEIPTPNQVTVVRRQFVVGDLESDTDDAALVEIQSQLRKSKSKISNLEADALNTSGTVDELRNMLLRQSQELEALRNMLAQQKTSHPKQFKDLNANAKLVESPKANKWNDIMKAGESVKMAPPPQHSMPSQVSTIEAPKVVPVSAAIEQEPVAPISVRFPMQYNPDLAQFVLPEEQPDGLSIQVPADIGADDLIFELRKGVANKGRITFGRVSLLLLGKPVIMSIDVNQNGIFSAQKAAEHAAAGELTVKIALGTAMTNAQIDMLVEKLEKEVALSVVANPEDAGELPTRQSVKNFAEMSSILPAGIEETLAGTIGQDQSTFLNVERSTDLSGVDDDGAVRVYRPTGQGRNTKSRRKIIKRRHWDEVEDEEEAEDDAAGLISNKLYREVRGSLEEALTSLSEKEGLTDDELKQKRTDLNEYTENLPTNLSQHMKSFRSSVAKSISTAAMDSGSESGGGEDVVLRSSLHSLRASRPSNETQLSISTRLLVEPATALNRSLRTSVSLKTGKHGSLHVTESGDYSTAIENVKRSISTYEEEDGQIVFGRAFSEDIPMMASMNRSRDSDRLEEALLDRKGLKSSLAGRDTEDFKPSFMQPSDRVRGRSNSTYSDDHEDVQQHPNSLGSTDGLTLGGLSAPSKNGGSGHNTSRSRYQSDEDNDAVDFGGSERIDNGNKTDRTAKFDDTVSTYAFDPLSSPDAKSARERTTSRLEGASTAGSDRFAESAFTGLGRSDGSLSSLPSHLNFDDNSSHTNNNTLTSEFMLSRTVDTEGEMLLPGRTGHSADAGDDTSLQRDVRSRADAYEAAAVEEFQQFDTPFQKHLSSTSKSNTGNLSTMSKNSSEPSLFKDLSKMGSGNVNPLDAEEDSVNSLAFSEDDSVANN